MTTPEPDGVARSVQLGIESEMRQIRAELDALRQRRLTYAGEFFTETGDGVKTFVTGPYYGVPLADGSPQWLTQIIDVNGQSRFIVWDPDPLSGGFIQTTWMLDHIGQILFTSDNNGGWAEPHLPVVLYPRFNPPAFPGLGNHYDYAIVDATAAGAERVAWAGNIGYVSHSRIWIRGTWGGTGGGTGEYKLKINGVTVGTWSVAGLSTDTRGPFSLLGAVSIGTREADVDLTVRRSAGSGDIACQVSHCHQRQT